MDAATDAHWGRTPSAPANPQEVEKIVSKIVKDGDHERSTDHDVAQRKDEGGHSSTGGDSHDADTSGSQDGSDSEEQTTSGSGATPTTTRVISHSRCAILIVTASVAALECVGDGVTGPCGSTTSSGDGEDTRDSNSRALWDEKTETRAAFGQQEQGHC